MVSRLQRANERRRRPKELLYLSLSDRDERIRCDVRYRAGRWFGGKAISLAVFIATGVPLAFVLEWRDGRSDELAPLQEALLLALWFVSLLGIYSWWFYKKQDWSELRRAYRFRNVVPEDDVEIADAKRVLLDRASTLNEREEGVQVLLSRGACSLNKVSIPREALNALLAFVIVMLILLVLVWLL